MNKTLNIMKTKYALLMLPMLMMLDSCGLYTSYKRPENLPLEGLYRDSVQQTDTTSLASLSWRKLFTDPCLQSLIEEGLAHNTDLQKAQLQTEEAEATLQQSRAAFLPSLSLTPEGKLSSYGGSKTQKTYSLGASSSWEIDAFGSLRNNKEQKKASFYESKAYALAVKTKLIATIADSYYTLLMLDRQLEITNNTLVAWQQEVRTEKALKEAGRVNEAQVNQAEANCLGAQHSILKLQQQISEQENSLSRLIGRVPQTITRGSLSNQTFPDALATGVPLNILSRRPDVYQSEYALRGSFYGVNKARSAFYPSLTLSGTAGWTNSGGMAIANPGKLLLSVLGSLTQPIFSKGQNEANLKIAKAQQQEALLSYTQAILDAGAEVNDALKQWQTALKKQDADRQEIEKLTKAVRNTKLLMENGTTNYLDVLTAEQNLLTAELSAVTDKNDEIEGVIALYHALGGGTE
jgi:outer membrane protein, multidrug efflux system